MPVLVLVLCAGACGRGDPDGSGRGLPPAAHPPSTDSIIVSADPGSSAALPTGAQDEAAVGDPDSAEAGAAPTELYYDLTAFDWFRRGGPLLHAGGRYEPSGPPIPIRASELRLLDRYQGVELYARENAGEPDTVYVPVSERYWLAFTRRSPTSAPAPTSDVPPDSLP